jgi:hypothetical protein
VIDGAVGWPLVGGNKNTWITGRVTVLRDIGLGMLYDQIASPMLVNRRVKKGLRLGQLRLCPLA